MNKVKLEILGLSASHSQSGSFALVLGEELGNRRLPIIIGMFEAQAIAIEMEKISSNRPMTHDLFKSLATEFDILIHEIVISDLKEGVFYAKIVTSFQDGTNFSELDARPSDAVALALRFGAPIYADESVLQEAGIVLHEDEEKSKKPREQRNPPRRKPEPVAKAPEQDSFERISIEQLNQMLDAALADEDYEKAAKIRDELNKRK